MYLNVKPYIEGKFYGADLENHLFSKYGKIVREYQGGGGRARNVSSSENVAYILN